jgi:hypothetical protein
LLAGCVVRDNPHWFGSNAALESLAPYDSRFFWSSTSKSSQRRINFWEMFRHLKPISRLISYFDHKTSSYNQP